MRVYVVVYGLNMLCAGSGLGQALGIASLAAAGQQLSALQLLL
jgi:hypothetical protein